MRWPAHIAIAWAVTAPFCPSYSVLAGATAPDWLEFVIEAVGGRVEHRWETHFLVWWLGGVLISAVLYFTIKPLAVLWSYSFWFFVGGLLHWLCDALTVSGVPIWWGSRYRIHLLGGKLRTGEPTEFFIALGLLAISFVVGWCRAGVGIGGGCFMVRCDYCGGYDEKIKIKDVELRIVSPKEMHDNRFKFF